MLPTAHDIIPQPQQQFSKQPFLRQPNRRCCRSGRTDFTYQPAGPASTTIIIHPSPANSNAIRPSHRSNPAVSEPFHSITLPPEPLAVHTSVPEHGRLDLVERMRRVQTMMIEIHRLENESRSGMNHGQQIQELHRRVMELSDSDVTHGTTGSTAAISRQQVSSHIPPSLGSIGVEINEPPPAYAR